MNSMVFACFLSEFGIVLMLLFVLREKKRAIDWVGNGEDLEGVGGGERIGSK